jgi:N-acetylated-alpha-linked acidic dipeptidase
LRLANADLLPFDFESYGASIERFIESLDAQSHASAHIDLSTLKDRVASFETAGHELNESLAAAISAGRVDSATARLVNNSLIQVERNWCNPQGIPGRPWWKHSLYAARYTYDHLELPGLTEAAEAKDWQRAAEQEAILEAELVKNTALLQEIKQQLDMSGEVSKP